MIEDFQKIWVHKHDGRLYFDVVVPIKHPEGDIFRGGEAFMAQGSPVLASVSVVEKYEGDYLILGKALERLIDECNTKGIKLNFGN